MSEKENTIVKAWEEYHGPITCELSGEDYIPAVPPIYMRGFTDGVEHSRERDREAITKLIEGWRNDVIEPVDELLRGETYREMLRSLAGELEEALKAND